MSLDKKKKSEFKNIINLHETLSNEEIKYLRNLNPEINTLFKISSNKKNYNTNSFSITNSSIIMSKDKFFKIILEEIQKRYIRDKNRIMPKLIGLIIKEISNISKLIEQNVILNELFDSVQKRKQSNIESRKKFKNLNIPNGNINKIENEIKERSRAQSQKHPLHFEKNKTKTDNTKIFKEVKFNKMRTKKKLMITDNDFLEASRFGYENENGCTDSRLLNETKTNETNDTFNNILIKENSNSNSSNKYTKKVTNAVKKVYHNMNYKKRNIKKDSTNNISTKKTDLFNKGKISMKRKHNKSLYMKHIEKDIVFTKNTINSDKKKIKFTSEQYIQDDKDKDSLNESYSTKKSNNKETSDTISTNISIIKFLNENSDILNNIESTNFDILILDQRIGKENTLSLIGYYTFNRFGYYNIINFNKFEKWCKKLSEGYIRANPYHTDLHAADITHTCLLYFKVGKVNEICRLSKNSKCSLFLSCMCHDYKHPGVNNNFLKETKNILSLTYNDNSILENMHIAETFKLINSKEEYNIFDGIDNNTYKQMRKEMISCVLATDMTFHNFYVDFMKQQTNLIKEYNNKDNNDKDKEKTENHENYQYYMNLLIHSADISNPTKPFDIYFKWAKLVIDEFYLQGDKEKKLGLVCSCDRNKTTIYQSQLGFINFIEIPYFTLFAELFKKLKFYFDTLNCNKDRLINMQQQENNKEKDKDKDKDKEEQKL